MGASGGNPLLERLDNQAPKGARLDEGSAAASTGGDSTLRVGGVAGEVPLGAALAGTAPVDEGLLGGAPVGEGLLGEGLPGEALVGAALVGAGLGAGTAAAAAVELTPAGGVTVPRAKGRAATGAGGTLAVNGREEIGDRLSAANDCNRAPAPLETGTCFRAERMFCRNVARTEVAAAGAAAGAGTGGVAAGVGACVATRGAGSRA